MTQDKIYYKVITNSRKSISMLNPDMRVNYPVNKWAYPKLNNSKLMVFDKKENALQFMQDLIDRGSLIVRCKVKNPIKLKYTPLLFCNKEDFGAFWNIFKKTLKNKKSLKRIYRNIVAPKGTVICDEVYCLE